MRREAVPLRPPGTNNELLLPYDETSATALAVVDGYTASAAHGSLVVRHHQRQEFVHEVFLFHAVRGVHAGLCALIAGHTHAITATTPPV
eukprot:COSAG05_NODE_2947_length_2475_cov_1.507155_3_plen_90_part_00